MKFLFPIILTSFFLLPLQGHAQVLLSEIAWMGSDSDANNEWIEIYNFSNNPTNLTGWMIEGSLSITLSGTLPPHGVALLERTDDDSVPGVTALLTYTGALPNEAGGTLTIKNASGGVSDQAVGGTNWSGIGGSNTVPKKTAQRTRTGTWITATPTPGAENAQSSDLAITATSTSNTQTAIVQKSGGGGGPAKRYTTGPKLLKNQSSELALTIDGPTTILVNEPVSFEVIPEGVGNNFARSLSYEWNLGDLSEAKGKKVSHTFLLPGTYMIAVEGVFGKKSAIARHEVTVLPVLISMKQTTTGEIAVTNAGTSEINLGGYALADQERTFTFPKLTFIKPGGVLTIPKTKFTGTGEASLTDVKGNTVATLKEGVASLATPLVSPKEVVSTTITESMVPKASPEVIRIGTPSEPVKESRLQSFLERFRIFFQP